MKIFYRLLEMHTTSYSLPFPLMQEDTKSYDLGSVIQA